MYQPFRCGGRGDWTRRRGRKQCKAAGIVTSAVSSRASARGTCSRGREHLFAPQQDHTGELKQRGSSKRLGDSVRRSPTALAPPCWFRGCVRQAHRVLQCVRCTLLGDVHPRSDARRNGERAIFSLFAFPHFSNPSPRASPFLFHLLLGLPPGAAHTSGTTAVFQVAAATWIVRNSNSES